MDRAKRWIRAKEQSGYADANRSEINSRREKIRRMEQEISDLNEKIKTRRQSIENINESLRYQSRFEKK